MPRHPAMKTGYERGGVKTAYSEKTKNGEKALNCNYKFRKSDSKFWRELPTKALIKWISFPCMAGVKIVFLPVL